MSTMALLMLVVSLSGCLKDQGYEDGEYGTITNRTTGKKFISIPLAANKPNVVGVEAKVGFQDINLFKFSYDYQSPADADIPVTVAQDNALVTALDPTIVLLPANAYQIVNLTTTIKAGQVISDPFVVRLNTELLDPTKKYGIAFRITDVPAGVQKSTNLNEAIFAFTIKNKYDGIYSFRCRMDHPADRDPAWNRGVWSYPYDIHLVTTGPNSVKMFNTAFAAGFHPLVTTGVSGFGSTEPNFVFDASDRLIDCFNGVAGARTFKLNPAVTNSRYDPATKTLYAAIMMGQTGFADIPIFDTLVFIKPRP